MKAEKAPDPKSTNGDASKNGKKPKKDKVKTRGGNGRARLSKDAYEKELKRLQVELVKLQYWVKQKGLKVVMIFEGRDAAGKGGTIKRVTEAMNPRGCRVVALGTPSDREKTQWYFQRYAEHLPASGEMVIFDRSWYNRSGVERVMGFCTDAEYWEFLRSCPEFERMLVRSGILVLKYWFSVSDEEQERRLRGRIKDPAKRWKLSPMDIESWDKWVEYSRAKDEMIAHTNIPEAPWFTVEADDKERARLNTINHILSKISYEDVTPEAVELTPRKPAGGYVRPPRGEQFYVPDIY
jgi:polyphosphate kinase